MTRTALLTAALATTLFTAQAQQGRQPSASHVRAADTAGKVAVPVGPVLPGEEKLSAQERAERTFLMPVRKAMPSVRPGATAATSPAEALVSGNALAIGPPTAAEAAAAEEAEAKAATAPRTYHRSSSRRHRSSSNRKKSSARRSSSSKKASSSTRKKTSAKKSTKKSTSTKSRSSSRRRR